MMLLRFKDQPTLLTVYHLFGSIYRDIESSQP